MILMVQPMNWGISVRDWLLAISLGLLIGVGNLALLAAYASDGKASIITPLSGLYPLITVPLAVILFHESITMRELCGTGLALLSVGAVF